MPDKTWDVLGDLPSDASATSSDEDDDGDRGDGSRGGSRGADLAAPEPRRVREVTYEDLVRRSYGGVVAAMDEDARRRRGEEAEASAAAKDDEGEGTRGKRRDEREGDSEDSNSDAKRPQLVQNAFGNWEMCGRKRVRREEEFLAEAAARREARGPTQGERRSAALKAELAQRMAREEKFDLSRIVNAKATNDNPR